MDTITENDISAECMNHQVCFSFVDMWDCTVTGKLAFENGKIHIQTTGEKTKMILDEWLDFDVGVFEQYIKLEVF